MHVIVWKFRVRPGAEAHFERAYGPRGAWVELFTKHDGFIRTELLRGSDGEYVTLDHWSSAAAYAAFHASAGEEYRRLDADCEGLTVEETAVGRFDLVS